MTTKTLYAPTLGSSFPTADASVLRRALAHWARYRRAQRDYARLLDMTPNQLADMGLTRDDVVRAKSEPLRLFGH